MTGETLTWIDVESHLRARYRTVRSDDSAIRIEVPTGKTSRSLLVLSSEAFGQPCATVVAMLGPADSISHRDALALCGSLLVGGLFLRDDVYLFRVTAPLASLTPHSLDAIIAYTTTEATRLVGNAMPPPHIDLIAFATAL